MKKPFITDILLVLSLIFLLIGMFRISNLTNENRKIKQELKKQKTTIKDLEEENEILLEIVEDRENEVSYWGMKYDSIKPL
jgi:cell division protein FtsB